MLQSIKQCTVVWLKGHFQTKVLLPGADSRSPPPEEECELIGHTSSHWEKDQGTV